MPRHLYCRKRPLRERLSRFSSLKERKTGRAKITVRDRLNSRGLLQPDEPDLLTLRAFLPQGPQHFFVFALDLGSD
jgi:hypothetical protein